MPKLHENTLLVSELLLDGSQPGSAARRRAVSTAYYALFQCLCALCAQCFSQARASSEDYRRAYRALEHRQAREALNRSEKLFKDNLASKFAELQDLRHWADYNTVSHPDEVKARLKKPFGLGDARDYVALARQAIAFIDTLDSPSRQRLAVQLIIRDRR